MFVYGTLKSGERNHHLCIDALGIEPATAQGRLFELPYGFPGIIVDGSKIQATGTTNYLADTRLQSAAHPAASSRGFDTVHGELLTFGDPETRLPALDALEGYKPGEPSFYERALYPVDGPGGGILAWLYCIPRPTGEHLPAGRWPV